MAFHTIRLDTHYTIVVRSLIKLLKIKGSCNNSHQPCLTSELLCLMVSKLGTVCANKEYMIDIINLPFVGNGTLYISEIFFNGMKSSRQLTNPSITKAWLSVLQILIWNGAQQTTGAYFIIFFPYH